MVEILVSIAAKVAEYVVDPVVRQLGYVCNYRANIQKLSEKVEEVKDIRNRLQLSVVSDERNGREIHEDVTKWLTSADGFIQEAGHPTGDQSVNASCFKGLCPNLKSRHMLGREAAKKVRVADGLIQDGSKFGSSAFPISHLPPLQLHHPLTSSSSAAAAPIASGAGFESRTSVLNAIMEALTGEGSSTVNKVGVWGLGGVGKTTLVNIVAQQAAEKKLFDDVVIASVMSTPDYNKIRQDLADQLGLQFVEEGENARADRLRERMMKKEKSILVILDDLWDEVDLRRIGVPSPDDHKGCKLLLTSRDRDVLSNQMDTQKNFLVEQLSEDEASLLFNNTTGDVLFKDPEFRSLPTDILKECGGLPIAIVTVAKALKGKTPGIWKDALAQLRKKGVIPTIISGMDTKVYRSLRLSYDFLENDEIKSFFLLCCQHPRDRIHTTDLLKYNMGLRLFNGIDTLEEARNRTESLVDKLAASNLLLHTGENSAVFTMHDLIRNVGIQVASEQHDRVIRFQNADGRALEERAPNMNDLRKLTMIHLVHSDELPEGLVCPNLKYLVSSYCENDPDLVVKIPDTFFNEMKGLNVLDFTNMNLPSLPRSLECLTNLRTLCLNGCRMGGDIALIAELKTLEILSLVDSNIEVLPMDMARLTRLRLLDLKRSWKLQVIPAGVIASLTRLENLCMENSFTRWEVDGGRNACVDELQRLPNLIDLDIEIPYVQLLPKDIAFNKLERYRIFIGDSWRLRWLGKFETNKTLKLKDYDINLHMVDGINKLLKTSEDLYLSGFRGGGGSNYALSRLDGEGFLKLKHLAVEWCEEIRYVMNSLELSHDSHCSAFPVLEILVLDGLSNLEQVCHGRFPAGSFGCLRKIKVVRCGSLKFLFSMTTARSLSVLEKLKLGGCKSMDYVVSQGRSQQELIEEENDDDGSSLFPKLRKLELRYLPELVSFCFNGDQNSSTRLQQKDLESASPILFDQQVTFPSLEELSIAGLDHVKKIWGIQLPHDHSFSNLKRTVKWFHRLQNLNVESCGSLQVVFDMEGDGSIGNVNQEVAGTTITQLSQLSCSFLPEVKQIWNEDLTHILSFRNLKSVSVFDCPSLKSIFPAALVLKDLVQLQKLVVSLCRIEEIVAEDKRTLTTIKTEPLMFVFPKLTSLTLTSLSQLKNFYPGPHISRWPSLKELKVDGCHQVINLFALPTTATAQDDEGSTSNISTTGHPLFSVQPVAFPCLEMLTLSFNDRITTLWQEQSPVDFPTLKDLTVNWYSHISVVIPLFMLQRLHNLEKLRVSSCNSVKEIFQLEPGLDVKNLAPRLGCLREICLKNLPELMHIWKGNDCEEPTTVLKLKSLENLRVFACESLKFLFPRLASFENLQSLEVESCGSLGSLMSASVAKTLAKLETLKICKSHKMEEVIDSNGGEVTVDENEIINFPKLKEMELGDLPNLTSFNSGGYNFSFPSLDRMKVEECPKMKIFSLGNVAARMLKSIQVTGNESHWKDDINATIHDLFAKAHA